MIRIERDNLAIFGSVAFFLTMTAVLTMVVVRQPQPKQETTITCTTNDSQIYEVQGWKKIETVDYHRKAFLAGKGEVQVECKPGSLMCTAFINGKAYPETKGCAWYWRNV